MGAQTIPDRGPGRTDQAAAWFLIGLMAAGCFALWIGVPAGCLWLAGRITESNAQHFLVALPLVLIGMGGFARFLFWLNRLYLRLTLAQEDVEEEPDDDEDEPRWARGPLEPLLVGTLLIALAALFVWFFVFAENPPRQVI